MGLVNRLVEPGRARETALGLAETLAAFPQECLRSDRLSSYEQWSMPLRLALGNETERGLEVVASEEMSAGVHRFVAGDGRGGT